MKRNLATVILIFVVTSLSGKDPISKISLPDGNLVVNHLAYSYIDGANSDEIGTGYNFTTHDVTKTSYLRVNLSTGGDYAVLFESRLAVLSVSINSSPINFKNL